VEATEAVAEEPTEPAAEEPTEAPAEAPTEAPTEAPKAEPTEAAAEQPASFDGEALLQERCTECHSLSRTTSASKSREQWEQTVTRMVDYGAALSDEEQAGLIEYLAENYGP
jgi:cytochrome c5